MSTRVLQLPGVAVRARSLRTSAPFLNLDQLRQRRGSEQVAAVCYRVRRSGVEFLLVKTRGGRWTFPKGSAEPGLTHAQAAALEAFEEAGVHGRMEEASFTSYTRHKGQNNRNRSLGAEIVVNAHLCQVLRLDPPQEADRNPTWFSPQKAMRRLEANRAADDGDKLSNVLELALSRISRLHGSLITS